MPDELDSDDLDHIERVRSGDREAFRFLVERHQGRAYALARLLLSDRQEAEDATQEGLVRAFRALPSFDARAGSFLPWLLAIIRNHCLNRLRKGERRRFAPDERAAERLDTITGEARAVRKEEHARLEAALAGLPIQQRLAFVLVEIHRLPLAEVARIECVRVGTVKSRLSRAKAGLREALRSTPELGR